MQEGDLLGKLGFTQYESRLVSSLITLGNATVRELVQHSKVPKNKAYEVLNKLEEKNVIESVPITPRRYKISNISVFSSMVDKKKNELRELETGLEDFKKRIVSPQKEFRDFFTVVKGRKNIQEQLSYRTANVKSEIVAVHGLSKYLPQNMREVKSAVERGVDVRFIALVTKENYSNIKQWKKTGCEIRVYDKKLFGETMPRFAVHDNKSVRITIGSPEVSTGEEYVSLYTESIALANMFRNYFYVMWDKLKEFK